MDQSRYNKYLIEYTRNALNNSDGTPSGAENYLHSQKKPGVFASAEKRTALIRAQKVFAEMQDRPLWLVLKALGLSEQDLE